MQIEVATTDAQLAQVAAIRGAVAPPGESAPNVAFLRHHLTISPELRYFLAHEGGEAVGTGMAGSIFPGDAEDYVPADATVLPELRRRGIGTALLRAASRHARSLARAGLLLEVREDDPGSLAYLAKRGYREVERQKAVALDLERTHPEAPEAPAGVEIVPRVEAHARGMYEAAREANADIPGLDAGHDPTFEQWRAFELDRPTRDPRLAFVALVDGEVAGFASVDVIGETGYHGLTGVRRADRRRGIARALKLHQIAAARALGLPRLVTESEERNEPMRRLNESLGYRPIPGMVVVQGPLLD